jgi:ASC-1-like (ASCH) protein
LSNHYGPPDLRVDLAKRRQILAVNEQVLNGAVAPAKVPTTRNYDSFHAVVARSRIVPTGWQKIYENDRYSLYRIPSRN